MKNSSLLSALVLGAALILNGAGCKKGNKGTILIPGPNARIESKDPNAGAGNFNAPPVPLGDGGVVAKPVDGGNPIGDSPWTKTLADGNADRSKLASDTVYFDTDSSTIRKSEESKLQAVADYFKSASAGEALRVEGYCDERGTEQYNVALGDRRAQAVRDYLANLGINAQRIAPVSFGEANPEDPGHGEEHWKKNRRGVFVVMTPK